jgi:1-deoxyxylulose-5-phosphate synthase
MRFSPRRRLGRTGFVATRLGAGDLADPVLGLDKCAKILRRAIDAGINVIDTAPSYEKGLSERVVGKALGGRRGEQIFVIDKIDHPTDPIEAQIDGSVDRLGFTPDAFVFHGVSDLAIWTAMAAPGGAMDKLGDAVRRGHCRFRGISSHHPDVVRAAVLSGTCDVVMFAVGPHVDARYTDELLPLAHAHGVGTVCFKTFGAGKLVAATEGYGKPIASGAATSDAALLTVEECIHTTLTLDPDVALLGLSTTEEQDAAFSAAERFTPLSPEALHGVRQRARLAVSGKGPCWWDPPARTTVPPPLETGDKP